MTFNTHQGKGIKMSSLLLKPLSAKKFIRVFVLITLCFLALVYFCILYAFLFLSQLSSLFYFAFYMHFCFYYISTINTADFIPLLYYRPGRLHC